AVARHRRRHVTLYRQNDVNFLVNEEPDSFAADFARQHGPCAVGFAIRVKDAARAERLAREKGAKFVTHKADTLPISVPTLEGIGGSALYLIDRYGPGKDPYADDFEYLPGVDRRPKGVGLQFIDHLTHNVHKGQMDTWAGFYERLFNFREIRYFDIKGVKTGLLSRAMTSPDGKVRIPINESADDKSQIAEYLRQYNGEGIQHIALHTDAIFDTVEAMKKSGVEFLDTPDAYYEMVDERVPGHGEDLERMRRDRILIDADPETHRRILLQIFTQNVIGPIFFEIIQRKGNEGFGEGNFRALFLAIERDQMRRGVI
ncbi:MAG TPA: 4-hydroxyphenylpyruvate dioxygenase, partial [Gammaproteobacteria bacterium]|nr:4-hydroxyphenylpyruvate dioxygenase [Gammaproteobacteria bacterium]